MKQKCVTIQYFAVFREKAQKDLEELTTDAETAGDFYQELANKYGFNMGAKHIRVAINDDFGSMNQKIETGDTLVFIPPVSGG